MMMMGNFLGAVVSCGHIHYLVFVIPAYFVNMYVASSVLSSLYACHIFVIEKQTI